jgi:hypothetical protein
MTTTAYFSSIKDMKENKSINQKINIMKKATLLYFLTAIVSFCSFAQDAPTPEKHGKTLNLGVGVGYYQYTTSSIPVLLANYEFDAGRNFTLAPFITFYSYSNHYYWGNPHYPYKYYSYRETVIPVGIKGAYYFDNLLNAGAKWDFYLAGSLGFAIRTVKWDSDYYGDTYAYHSSSGIYLDLHVGTKFHFNDHIGMFLDLSTGVSSVGLSIH